MAVNCIETDVQSMLNGCDFDSDFLLVTNNPTIVQCAKVCYKDFPTIVNALKESGIVYGNSKTDYAIMDNRFAGSQMGIGWSSNLAQLAMTYYWTEKAKDEPNEVLLKEYYDIFVILSVIAQLQIDSCKRLYEIDGNDEIKRISKLPCMTMTKTIETVNGKAKTIKCDFPAFMKYTREIKVTKDGKELPYETISNNRHKLNRRINYDLECPMNWLEEWLDKIQGASREDTVPTEKFFIKIQGKANDRQMSKIYKLAEAYDGWIKYYAMRYQNGENTFISMVNISDEFVEEIRRIKIGNITTINRLIEIALGLSCEVGLSHYRQYDPTKYARKILNLLYKYDKNKFLSNFIY